MTFVHEATQIDDKLKLLTSAITGTTSRTKGIRRRVRSAHIALLNGPDNRCDLPFLHSSS